MPDEIKRVNYFDRQFLRADDFITEQTYHLEQRRRHNQYLHSPGIAEGGLEVSLIAGRAQPTVRISPGLAIDTQGREMILIEEREVPLPSDQPSINLYILYGEQPTDSSTDPGVEGFTRVTETPSFRSIPVDSSPPTDALLLARITFEESINIDNSLRQIVQNALRYINSRQDSTIVNNEKFGELLYILRRILSIRLEKQRLFVSTNSISEHNRTIIYSKVYYINQVCLTGYLLANTQNINTNNALVILMELHNLQSDFLTALKRYSDNSETRNNFVEEYRQRLERLESALNSTPNLVQAYLEQQQLNMWLTNATPELEAATFLANNFNQLLDNAFQQAAQRFPNIPLSDSFKEIFLSLRSGVIQSVEEGQVEFVEQALAEAQESVDSLELPRSLYSEVFRQMKRGISDNISLSDEAKSMSNTIFDYAISYFT